MKNKKQIRTIINKAIKASFKDGKLLELKALNFANFFKAQPRVEAIELLSEFLRRLKIEMNATALVIESVIPLSKKQQDIIKKKFSSKFTITNSQVKINPEILGGLKIRVGDHIYDDSIQARIYQVKEAIVGN